MKGYLLPVAFVVLANPALADTEAIIVGRHEFEAIDLSIGPAPLTVGEYLQRYPPTSVWRVANYPRQRMAEFTVVTPQGQQLKVTQKIAVGLEVGAHVRLIEVNGERQLVAH